MYYASGNGAEKNQHFNITELNGKMILFSINTR